MNRTDRQSECDLQGQIKQYQEGLEAILEKYVKLQKKFEMMKDLELNLRYEIYQLKQQLNHHKIYHSIHHEDKNYHMYLHFGPLLDNLRVTLNRSLDQNDQQYILDSCIHHSDFIHRPFKKINYTAGLGKESLPRMKENYETNETEISHNKTEHDQNSQEQISQDNSGSYETNTQQSIQKTTDEPDKQLKTNTINDSSNITNFNDLKKLVQNLNDQVINSDPRSEHQQMENKNKFNHDPTNEQKHTTEIKRPPNIPITFRDLQKAQQIYSKPLARMNTTTTMSINREIKDQLQTKEQLSNKQVEVNPDDHVEEKKDKSEKKHNKQSYKKELLHDIDVKTVEIKQENRVEKKDIVHSKEADIKSAKNIKDNQVKSNDSAVEAKDDSIGLTTEIKQNKETQQTSNISNEEEQQKNQANKTELIENSQQKKQDEVQKQLATKHRKVEESPLPVHKTESLTMTESENNQHIFKEPEMREKTNTHPTQEKKESFFKSLWKKLK